MVLPWPMILGSFSFVAEQGLNLCMETTMHMPGAYGTTYLIVCDLAHQHNAWWRHQMETFSALLALCAGEFSSQRPVTRSFAVFFDLRLNKRLSK